MSEEFLNLDAILAAPDVSETEVDVEEWGGKVKVKSLTKAEQIRVRKNATRKDGTIDDTKMEGGLLVTGLVSPSVEEYQIPNLFAKSSTAVDKILQAILGASGMDGDSVGTAEAAIKS